MRLPTVACVLAFSVFFVLTAAVSAQEVSPGFARLIETAADRVGLPLASERPGDAPGSTIVPTTTGILYWQSGLAPSWTDGFARLTLDDDDDIVTWESLDALAPPPREPQLFIAGVMSPSLHIATRSRYAARAVCVSRIETGSWTAYWNPTPVGREHAQGYFGWLPSTFYSVAPASARIMNLDDEIAAFDTMLDRRRGTEFAGILWGVC